MTGTTQVLVPEGWYVDERDTTRLRWWTGTEWTDRLRPHPDAQLETGWEGIPDRWSTVSVWVIVSTPLLMAVALVAAAALVNRDGFSWEAALVLAIPYLLTVAFAPLDELRLRRWGHEHTANWLWALLGAPAYVIARGVILQRHAAVGLAALWMWIITVLVAVLALGAYVLVVLPGVELDQVVGSISFASLGLG